MLRTIRAQTTTPPKHKTEKNNMCPANASHVCQLTWSLSLHWPARRDVWAFGLNRMFNRLILHHHFISQTHVSRILRYARMEFVEVDHNNVLRLICCGTSQYLLHTITGARSRCICFVATSLSEHRLVVQARGREHRYIS
jgi:hypothetical protein